MSLDPVGMAMTSGRIAVIAGTAAGANIAAAVVSADTRDLSATTIAAGITAVVLAICGAIVTISPVIANAIRTIGPALAELQKQREDIKKGSLSGQIDELRKSLEDKADDLADAQRKASLDLAEANQRAAEALAAANKKSSDALAEAHQKAEIERQEIDRVHTESLAALRKNLHDVRNQMQNDALRREADIVARDEKIQSLEQQISALRAEETRLLAELAQRSDVQDAKIVENRQAIDRIKSDQSGTMTIIQVEHAPKAPDDHS